MTAPRDKAREIVDGWGKGRVMSSANYDSIVAAISAALIEYGQACREVERQRCAALVEEMGKSVKGGYNNAAHEMAAAIRRGK